MSGTLGIDIIITLVKKRIFYIIACFLIVLSSNAFSEEEPSLEKKFYSSAGYLKIGTAESATVSFGGDLNRGDFSFGFDIIAVVSDKKPDKIDSIIIRDLEYETGTVGIIYDEIRDISFGQGLLVRNYTPWARGPALFSNDAVGFQGYYDGDIIDLNAFGTWSHVYGLRFSEDFFPYCILGQTFVTDVDGFEIKEKSGALKNIDKAVGYGLDIRSQLFEDTNFYVEAAKLEDHGGACALGVIFERDRLFLNTTFSVERRFVDPDFIPGYFDAFYEESPVDLSLVKADAGRKDGYLASFDFMVLGIVDLNLMLETYDFGLPALGGDLRLWSVRDFYLRFYYREPSYRDFRVVDFKDAKTVGGSMTFGITPNITSGVHFRKSYNPDQGLVEESGYFDVKYLF